MNSLTDFPVTGTLTDFNCIASTIAHSLQFNSIFNLILFFLFKVDTFGNVTNNISFKLLHRLNFRNNTKIIALYN